ncbi:MAG: DUF4886 domain-containing protein [Myxococcota bacterium]|nr:DUF4886 domain-containing protein [Myxococcota bacterium]
MLPLLLTLPAAAQLQPGEWGVNDTPDILLMGNSYTFYNGGLDAALRPMLEEGLGVSEVRVRILAEPGRSLADHAGWAADPEHAWNLALEEGEWDYLVAQDQSQIPGFPQTETYWQDSRDAAVYLGQRVNDQGGELVLLMTWGRRDGDSQNASLYPDYATMQARLEDGYLAYAEATQGRIAPAGLAWEVIHQDILDDGGTPTDNPGFTDLYVADGSHPSVEGTLLAASVIYASITGRSPIGLTTAYQDVSAARRDQLQQAAHRAVFESGPGRVPMPYLWEDDRIAQAGGVLSHGGQWVTGYVSDHQGDLVLSETSTAWIAGQLDGAILGDGKVVLAGTWMLPELGVTLEGQLVGEGTLVLPDLPSPGDTILQANTCDDLSTVEVIGPQGDPVPVVVEGCLLYASNGEPSDDTGLSSDPGGCGGCAHGPGGSPAWILPLVLLGLARRRDP